jgi:transketolase C-terminal domain/subunit
MASSALEIGGERGFDSMSVVRIKPFPEKLVAELKNYEKIFVLEEHHRSGGLFSAIAEEIALDHRDSKNSPTLFSIALKDQFANRCGGHEYALSEHDLTNDQIRSSIDLNTSKKIPV